MPYNKNIQCIGRILKWINKMRNLLNEFSILDFDDFENNETCQLAISQLITNVYELVRKIDENFYIHIPKFIKLRNRIKLSRNIASHEYEFLDLDIVYRLVLNLTDEKIINELEAAIIESEND